MVESTNQLTKLPPLIDPIAFAQDDKYMKQLGEGDELVYADNIKKKNSRGSIQKRIIAITNNAVYNFDGKKLKRKIFIKDLLGLSKTVHPSTNLITFTIHHLFEHDYNYYHDTDREGIILKFKQVYYLKTGMNLPIYHVQTADLEPYTTTESDVKKHKNRHPPKN